MSPSQWVELTEAELRQYYAEYIKNGDTIGKESEVYKITV